jgi:hypothetical protein
MACRIVHIRFALVNKLLKIADRARFSFAIIKRGWKKDAQIEAGVMSASAITKVATTTVRSDML